MTNLSAESALEKVIFSKVEATYGTDAVPGATNALLTEDFKLEAANTDKVSRNIDRGGLGGTPDALGAFSAKVDFKVPLTGSGAAGTLPAFTDIMRACQFNAVVDAGMSVTSNLVSGDLESTTIYYYHNDARLRRLRGFRGAMGISFKNGGIPYLMVSGAALYAAGVDAQTPPTPDYTNTQNPKTVSYDNTEVFTLDGTDLVLIDLDIGTPSNVKHRDAPNQEEVRASGRRDYSGKLTVLQRPLADFDPETALRAGTLLPLHVVHGKTGRHIVDVSAPKVQIVGVSEGEEDGDATWELDLNITATGAGDDDLVIVFK